MSLAHRLRHENAPVFDAALAHPFVQGIGRGTLPREVFARWIEQDWLYLKGYIVAVEQASRLATCSLAARRWQELARLTREVELDLHRALARKFHRSPVSLDRCAPYPATTAYLATLAEASQTYPGIVATLTPCAVGYAEIARALHAQGPCPAPDYAAWIATYTDPLFQEAAAWFAHELDRCAQQLPDPTALALAYQRAAQSELAFWQALWEGG